MAIFWPLFKWFNIILKYDSFTAMRMMPNHVLNEVKGLISPNHRPIPYSSQSIKRDLRLAAFDIISSISFLEKTTDNLCLFIGL